MYTAPTVPETVPETPAKVIKEVPDLQGKNAPEENDSSSAEIRVPVANANKLLYDLDATVNQMFADSTPGKEEKSADVGIEDAQVYSAANRELDFYPRQTDAAHQSATLVTQLEGLEKRLLVSEP